jgi:pimeloyl-ACP methyl ester carboxylesterase
MPREAEVVDLAALATAAAALPEHPHFVTVGEAGGRPVRLAYRHTRGSDGKRLVVMLHGLLSDSRTWRFMAGNLGRAYDLLLIDLMGCGQSDKPDPRDLGPDGYSPTALARQVLLVIQKRSKHERIALVGHSLGGMVTLRMLGDPDLRAEFPDVLKRVDRAILLSAVDFAVERVHPVFSRIAKLSPIEVAIGGALGIVHKLAAQAVRNGTSAPGRMPGEEAERLVEILLDPASRRAAQAMIRQAVPFTADERPDWERIERLVAEYRNVNVPCLILWGARDETFPASMGYKLRAQLPRAWLHVLPKRMHKLPVEAPLVCAKDIRRFVATAGAGSPRIRDGVVDSVRLRASRYGGQVGYALPAKGGPHGNLGP